MACSVGLCTVVAVAIVFGVAQTTTAEDYEYEKDPTYWRNVAQEELDKTLQAQQRGVAKNVILFLGDGMGPTTVTAARILAGQKLGKSGEEYKLSFDDFPYTGLSRTYNTKNQITDSAGSGTAYLTGVKTGQGILGLSGAAERGTCASVKGNEVESIVRWSIKEGKSTGVVTTTRITHATPGASYAHIPERNWESDRQIPDSEKNCQDIALQLIEHNSDINVLMGGGRAAFYPENFVDPDPDPNYNTSKASRIDGKNLVQDWIDGQNSQGHNHAYVYNKAKFDEVSALETDYLLGLFNQDHMAYELDRNPAKEPSIAEMTRKAIEILKKNEKGFFLLVEGGRIDHGHHVSQPAYALNDVLAMADAVDEAIKITDKKDTLVVVTADHSHVMSIAGYASRGNDILGISDDDHKPNIQYTSDHKTYTTLVYGNGPGYVEIRPNATAHDVESLNYTSQSAVPMGMETHGGEDVAIYASGPQSFLFTGVHEQNYIPTVMAYASCVGPYAENAKPCAKYQQIPQTRYNNNNNNGVLMTSSLAILICAIVLHLFVS